jgi:ribosomal-protein-alanine N-acetyltransferase
MNAPEDPRLTGPADTPILAALHAVCFDDPWSLQAMVDILASPGVTAWLAFDRDAGGTSAPAGFAIIRLTTDEGELLSLGVAAAFRRRSIARRLLAMGMRYAAECGARRIFLEVAEDNLAAQALYAAEGFEVVGRRPAYYRRADGAPVAAITLRRRIAGRIWRLRL